jgi:predicted alpha/beta hydrolase family esterase
LYLATRAKYTATLTSCAYSYLSTKEKTMQKTVLNDVFELLQQIGAVSSESEFSRDWLCRSECYMRTLRFKRVKPSVGTLAICASKLQHYGRYMTATECHTQLGKQFIELSERCHKQINADAVGWWKEELRV